MIPKKLIDEIKLWIAEGRYGNIQINFSGGKIVNFNTAQSFKLDSIVVIIPEMNATKTLGDTAGI